MNEHTAPQTVSLGRLVGSEVEVIMRLQGKNRRHLADLLGISAQTATRRVTGEMPFDLNELEAVSRWLDVPVPRLVDRSRSVARQFLPEQLGATG